MSKLIAHIAVALALWYGLSHFGVAVWARLPAIVAGAFGVHWFWETFFPVDPAYFGHLPIAQDDPLMLAARQRGRETLDTFRRLYPEHPNDTIVRFGMQMPSGNKEYLWADLLTLEADTATVYVRTPPTEPEALTSMNMTIPFADIDDWQIEFRDGSLRGGFTNRAMFKMMERGEGKLHPAYHEQLQRYQEV